MEHARGHAELGDAHCSEAEAAGNDRERVDTQRPQAVEAAKGETRRGLAQFLLDKDLQRYGWAKEYL